MTDKHTVTVNEDKFNGTSTLNIIADSREQARRAAEMFWKENHGSRPSKVVVEKQDYRLVERGWDVMVADHSSGSLKQQKEYQVPHPDDYKDEEE